MAFDNGRGAVVTRHSNGIKQYRYRAWAIWHFEWFAEFHQLTGMMLLLSMLAVLYVVKPVQAA